MALNLNSIVSKYRPFKKWRHIFENISAAEVAKTILGPDNILKDNVLELTRNISDFISNHQKVPSLLYYFREQNSLNEALDKKIVKLFLKELIFGVIPVKLLGSMKNKRATMLFLLELPYKGMYETIWISSLLDKCDISLPKWMHGIPENKKINVFNKLIVWMIQSYIFKVLELFFFISKSVNSNELHYFWRKSWLSLTERSFHKLRKGGKFQKENNVTKDILSLKAIKFSYLHFRVKKSGLRPLMLPGKNSKNIDEYKFSLLTNKFLGRLLDQVLNESPFKRGADFLTVWQQTVSELREKKIHFVKIDVKDAFGSVKHNILEDILKFLFRKYVKPMKAFILSRVDVFVKLKTILSNGKKQVLVDIFDEEFDSFHANIELLNPELMLGVIVKSFKFHVFSWMGQLYTMSEGLAQGALFSPVLCNLYLHAVGMHYLLPFCSDGSLLFREVDDYLYVTPSHDDAVRFYNMFVKGFEFYGININKKTQTSDTERIINFLGYAIDSVNMEVKLDYTKYYHTDLAHMLHLDMNKFINVQRFLKRKISKMLSIPKLLLDSHINRFETHLEIIFMVCCLQAFRVNSLMKHFLKHNDCSECVVEYALISSSVLATKIKLCQSRELCSPMQCKYMMFKAFSAVFKTRHKFSIAYHRVIKSIEENVKNIDIINRVMEDVIHNGEMFKKMSV